MHMTPKHLSTVSRQDDREEIFAVIRLLEYVRHSLPAAQSQSADPHLQAAIDAIETGLARKH
jgi:hypothetical protein